LLELDDDDERLLSDDAPDDICMRTVVVVVVVVDLGDVLLHPIVVITKAFAKLLPPPLTIAAATMAHTQTQNRFSLVAVQLIGLPVSIDRISVAFNNLYTPGSRVVIC